jgi:glycerophosphoryl diester phosphodiesterase
MTAPVTIAHRAGNSRDALEPAVAAGVDAIEVDIRLDQGRLVARHDRRFPFSPLYYDRWHLRLSLDRQITLEELLDRLAGRAHLLVDVKSTSARALQRLLDTLRSRDAAAGTRMSSAFWHLLRRAHLSEPRIKMHYSIGAPEELARFWELQQGTHEADGVSIKQRLLDKALSDRFRAEGIEIAAYDVHDLQRARELIGWGTAAIISGDLALLRRLKAPPEG